jgi:hypothetical protein
MTTLVVRTDLDNLPGHGSPYIWVNTLVQKLSALIIAGVSSRKANEANVRKSEKRSTASIATPKVGGQRHRGEMRILVLIN